MKKKLLTAILVLVMTASMAMALVGCNDNGGGGGHTHTGGTATCTEKAVCSSCGEEYGEVLDHTYGNWTVTTNATCTTEGERVRSCDCGETDTETISATGHTYASGWATDDTHHWKVATCEHTNEVKDKEAHNLDNGVCSVCSFVAQTQYQRVNASGEESANGEYILFGSYPQTDVTATASSLGLTSGTLPTSGNLNGWTSYGYYSNSTNTVDFMWYKDVTVGNEKYRAVYFTSYRPSLSRYEVSQSSGYQKSNGYNSKTVYWFKFEPIKWKILQENYGGNNYALIICDMVIDSQEFQSTLSGNGPYYNNTSGTPSNTYANNYAYSSIRTWLNNSFYNTSFTELQKALIQTTQVDNDDVKSTTPYICADTQDKIFLSGYLESDRYTVMDSESERQKKSTDYAKAQGIYVNNRDGASWWLRAPSPDTSEYTGGSGSATCVDPSGSNGRSDSSGNSYYVDSTDRGVVPLLVIALT